MIVAACERIGRRILRHHRISPDLCVGPAMGPAKPACANSDGQLLHQHDLITEHDMVVQNNTVCGGLIRRR